ncbi:MAG: type II secretion system GspH family protein, partial [Phycisphaerales bacterium]|nr:type II secretion system GspH family protein [Phycisphaerales bacterium]
MAPTLRFMWRVGDRRLRPARRLGFTLVEVLATIAIIGAIGSVASLTLLSALDGYVDAATQAQLHSELSIAVDR